MPTSSQNPSIFTRFKQTYAPLYRILLVLSSLAALASLTDVRSIRVALTHLHTDPFYALSGIITVGIVTPLLIASIILLWCKHVAGIRLRLSAYAASLIAVSFGFFTSRATITEIIRQAVEQAKASGSPLSPETVARITEISFYSALTLSIILSVVFAILWWKAWKRQLVFDKKQHTPKKRLFTAPKD